MGAARLAWRRRCCTQHAPERATPRRTCRTYARVRGIHAHQHASGGANLMRELRGICTAITTPFDEQGELNLDALDPFLDFQQSAGIEGVVVCGTNGEGTSLSVDERK